MSHLKNIAYFFELFYYDMHVYFFKSKKLLCNWPYPILIAFGSVYLEKIPVIGWRKYVRPVSIVWVLGLSIPFFMVAFPIQSPEQIQKNIKYYKGLGLLRWEDGREHNLPQDFADMIG